LSPARLPRGPKPQIKTGAEVWAYCRHYWRRVRVLEFRGRGGARVLVGYRLSLSGRLVRQELSVWNLKADRPSEKYWRLVLANVPAPALAELCPVQGLAALPAEE
jgi:hypothetical protein